MENIAQQFKNNNAHPLSAQMPREVFKEIQSQLGLSNSQMARTLGVAITTVEYYRSGHLHIKGPVAVAMRLLKERGAK